MAWRIQKMRSSYLITILICFATHAYADGYMLKQGRIFNSKVTVFSLTENISIIARSRGI